MTFIEDYDSKPYGIIPGPGRRDPDDDGIVAQRVLVQRPQWVCGHCGGYVKAIGACCPSCGAVLVGYKGGERS